MFHSKIAGMGFHVPNQVITNHDLAQQIDTSDEWIETRSGIKERRWASKDVSTFNLAHQASMNAISNANIDPEGIDMIIVGTLSSDYFFPGVSAQLQDSLNLKTVGAFDIKAACSAFIYSLSIADQFIKTGMAKKILVVGAEAQTKLIDKSTKGIDVAVLFGDGAGAAILQRSDNNNGILSTHLYCEGKHIKNLWMQAPGTSPGSWFKNQTFDEDRFTPHMNGREVFRNAVKRFPEVINEALISNKLSINDIKLIIPHQANKRIMDMTANKLGISKDKVLVTVDKYANTSSASIPLTLDHALSKKIVKRGDIIVFEAIGGGLTWGCSILKY